mmetsp:Transcript_22525/g.72505  ORF Transcript_22525/g.72505 Transcript_22525/m.72505 type:complete len:264 (+) Transcript_22525:225-1016(+)
MLASRPEHVQHRIRHSRSPNRHVLSDFTFQDPARVPAFQLAPSQSQLGARVPQRIWPCICLRRHRLLRGRHTTSTALLRSSHWLCCRLRRGFHLLLVLPLLLGRLDPVQQRLPHEHVHHAQNAIALLRQRGQCVDHVVLQETLRVQRLQQPYHLRRQSERDELRHWQHHRSSAERHAEVDAHQPPRPLVQQEVVQVAVADAKHVLRDVESGKASRKVRPQRQERLGPQRHRPNHAAQQVLTHHAPALVEHALRLVSWDDRVRA